MNWIDLLLALSVALIFSAITPFVVLGVLVEAG